MPPTISTIPSIFIAFMLSPPATASFVSSGQVPSFIRRSQMLAEERGKLRFGNRFAETEVPDKRRSTFKVSNGSMRQNRKHHHYVRHRTPRHRENALNVGTLLLNVRAS